MEPNGGKMAHAVAGHSGHICGDAPLHGRSNHGTELTYGEKKNCGGLQNYQAFCDLSSLSRHVSMILQMQFSKNPGNFYLFFSAISVHVCDCLCLLHVALHLTGSHTGADLAFFQGGGGFDPTTMQSIVHEPRSGEPIFLVLF